MAIDAAELRNYGILKWINEINIFVLVTAYQK